MATREELIKQCRYYKGETECPYTDGRSVWWGIENDAVNRGDKTDKGISKSMWNFILERIWQSDCGWYNDTTRHINRRTAIKRANELYDCGKWGAGYLWDIQDTIQNCY